MHNNPQMDKMPSGPEGSVGMLIISWDGVGDVSGE